MSRACLVLACLLLTACGSYEQVPVQELRVAVASNFLPTLERLAEAYRQGRPDQPLKIHTMGASSGLLYAQIAAGAPFDLFFSADSERPQQLVKTGKTLGDARVYALGRLALWAPRPNHQMALKRLREREYEHLVIANPNVAPYGQAAREVLTRLGLWEAVRGKLIRGENVAQAYQYLHSGRAELGFVAVPQLRQTNGRMDSESVWLVPATMHTPLTQAAVLLPGSSQPQAEAFLAFCLGKEGRAIIESAGYDLPELY